MLWRAAAAGRKDAVRFLSGLFRQYLLYPGCIHIPDWLSAKLKGTADAAGDFQPVEDDDHPSKEHVKNPEQLRLQRFRSHWGNDRCCIRAKKTEKQKTKQRWCRMKSNDETRGAGIFYRNTGWYSVQYQGRAGQDDLNRKPWPAGWSETTCRYI